MKKNTSRNREKSDEAVVFRAFGSALFMMCVSALFAVLMTYVLVSEVLGEDYSIIVNILIIFVIAASLLSVFENALMLRAKIIIEPNKIVLVGATHETKKKRAFVPTRTWAYRPCAAPHTISVYIEIPWRDIRHIESENRGGLNLLWGYTILHFKTKGNSDYTMILDYFDGRKLKKEIGKYHHKGIQEII